MHTATQPLRQFVSKCGYFSTVRVERFLDFRIYLRVFRTLVGLGVRVGRDFLMRPKIAAASAASRGPVKGHAWMGSTRGSNYL